MEINYHIKQKFSLPFWPSCLREIISEVWPLFQIRPWMIWDGTMAIVVTMDSWTASEVRPKRANWSLTRPPTWELHRETSVGFQHFGQGNYYASGRLVQYKQDVTIDNLWSWISSLSSGSQRLPDDKVSYVGYLLQPLLWPGVSAGAIP